MTLSENKASTPYCNIMTAFKLIQIVNSKQNLSSTDVISDEDNKRVTASYYYKMSTANYSIYSRNKLKWLCLHYCLLLSYTLGTLKN